jgi:hypothetical protein
LRERESKAVGMRRENHDYGTIAAACGWETEAGARLAVERALRRAEATNIEEYRRVEGAKLDAAEAELLEIRSTRHVVVSHGRVVYDLGPDNEDGSRGESLPVEDVGPRIRAIQAFIRVAERRSKLQGGDAPMRKVIEVYTQELGQKAVDELNAQLAALEAAEAREQVEASYT